MKRMTDLAAWLQEHTEVSGSKIVFGGDVQADGKFLDSEGHEIGGGGSLHIHSLYIECENSDEGIYDYGAIAITTNSSTPYTIETLKSLLGNNRLYLTKASSESTDSNMILLVINDTLSLMWDGDPLPVTSIIDSVINL